MNLDKCPCSGINLDKLIQPTILTILAEEDLYGYRIVQRIAEKAMFSGHKPDGTGIYRSLRLMEKRGLVASSWDLSDSGPARRFYQLNQAGLECLWRWIGSLEAYRQAIGGLLDEAYLACAKASSTAGNDQT